MLISDDYLTLNKELHAGGGYGIKGDRWLKTVKTLIERFRPDTILDYGCGQGMLGRALDRPIAEYDPAIEGKDTLPVGADLVVCTDVLEHVEPEFIDSTLDHLQSLTGKCLFAVIATRPARKFLPDGRNAHLIVRPWEWWEPKITNRFGIYKILIKENLETRLILTPLSNRV